MPPALHPRSGFTTTLFGATLAVSFLVVGLPHILPCPVPARQFAEGSRDGFIVDENGKPLRRIRRRIPTDTDKDKTTESIEANALPAMKQRECPVPKPSGLIGQVMGFKQEEGSKMRVPVEVRIESASRGQEGGGGKA